MNRFKDILSKQSSLYCFAESLSQCEKLLAGGSRIIQVRHKGADDQVLFNISKEMLKAVRQYEDALLIINDRVDLAIDINADGVHVGASDEPAAEVAARVPGHMIVGVSARTVPDALKAQEAGASYLGTGAVFPTQTKPDAKVIGIEGLKKIVEAVSIPVAAIGGITLENARDVMAAGARYCAVISGINDAPDITERVKGFLEIIDAGELKD